MSSGFAKQHEERIYRGKIIEVATGTFRGPDGSTFTRDIVHHPGAVAVVPVRPDGRVVLVRQYRAPLDAMLLEIPAGLRDVSGEASFDTAHRELIEETGLRAGSMERLVTVANSAGFCDEEIEIFLGTELEVSERSLQGIEEQHMTVEEISFDDVDAMIASGELRDAKTVIGLLAAMRRLRR